jgi:hypothetical protein
MRLVLLIALNVLTAALVPAQTGNRKLEPNPYSPPADTSMKLEGHAITIEYNAPSARGRKVEGGLIPYDHWWRLGADTATTLTSEADITIGGVRVPKGVHTLYLLASESAVSRFTPLAVVIHWVLVVNKQTGQWGTEYNESQDVARTEMKVTKLGKPVETLKITLTSATAKAGKLEIEWGQSQGEVAVKLR